MPSANIVREIDIIRSPRVLQLEGLFDIPPTQKSKEQWTVDLPLDEKPWNIGLIVGPSGSGKTTILNELFKDYIFKGFKWPKDKSVIDAFPKDMGIKDIIKLLSSVGFSSPPSWMRPFHILSNGEQFRVNMARVLAESKKLCVVDEFTSVVDRTVAKIGSHAVAKTVREMNKRLIVASCHYDIEEWLQPDWIYQPHENAFKWRRLRQRPRIDLKIIKVHRSAWELFKQYHYLTRQISKAAQCFVAFWNDVPVAFVSYIHLQNNRIKNGKRGHRIVCLPDYQGVGIGVSLVDYIASCLKTLGFVFYGRTSHPGIIAYRAKSKNWQLLYNPKVSSNHAGTGKKNTVKYLGRMVATFKYIGPSISIGEARQLIR